MLLSDEEKNAVYLQWLTRTGDMLLLIDLTEAALLAKLASAELPEQVDLSDPIDGRSAYGYTAYQLRQAYAQGAAAQLAEKPAWYAYRVNGSRWQCVPASYVPYEDDYDEGTLIELYTRRQA